MYDNIIKKVIMMLCEDHFTFFEVQVLVVASNINYRSVDDDRILLQLISWISSLHQWSLVRAGPLHVFSSRFVLHDTALH